MPAQSGAKQVSVLQGWETVVVGTGAPVQSQGTVMVLRRRQALTGQVGQREWVVMVGQDAWSARAWLVRVSRRAWGTRWMAGTYLTSSAKTI